MTDIGRYGVLLALICAQPVLAAVEARGPVTVEFVQPEKFTDVSDRMLRTAPDKNPNLHSLRQHTLARAARYLQPGQTLTIAFTDIDLAGDFRPQLDPALSDVRLVTRLYPPRIKLNFVLHDAAGAVLKSGQADLRDLGFDTSYSGSTTDSLRFEKRLLDKWMRKEFGG